VHLKAKSSVDRASLNRSAWAKDFAPSWGPQLYLFAGDTAPGGSLYARMFAPALGIDEAPATGGAAATLAAAISEKLVARDGTFSWVITQGGAMGRPSRVEASARKEKGLVAKVSGTDGDRR
jgi:trans-2,3-dihydro-3-hydroxyanthranilate isomerase